ncbi:MAG: cytochrome P450 [Actinomycetota bacterium]|jgi:cytochrome P450
MDLRELADLNNPAFYARDPYPVYQRLRVEAPVFWYEPGQYWALSKHEDVKFVSRDPGLFSSNYGLRPTESIPPDDEAEITDPTGLPRRAELRRQMDLSQLLGGEMIVALDPPRHTKLRRLVSTAFTPRMVANLEAEVEVLTRQALDAIEPGTVHDFVESVALPIPMYVIAKMLGVPPEDYPAFRRWSDAIVAATDAMADRHSETMGHLFEQLMELMSYFMEALTDRRDNPRDDLITALGQAEVDGERISEPNQLLLLLVVLVGGNETTRSLLSGGIKLLADFPDQRRLLMERPELINLAVEEILRYWTPVVTMGRTATRATEIRGQAIAPGDFVVMLWQSANRDEDAWERPDVFDITREPDPMHMAFGFGQHFCLGAALARCEARIVFSEMLRRFPDYEIAGEIKRTESMLTPGMELMPVLFK